MDAVLLVASVGIPLAVHGSSGIGTSTSAGSRRGQTCIGSSGAPALSRSSANRSNLWGPFGTFGTAIGRLTLCLSLGLFSLSILEATPESWCVWLLPGSRRLVRLYRIILWADSVLIAGVVPAYLGIGCVRSIGYATTGATRSRGRGVVAGGGFVTEPGHVDWMSRRAGEKTGVHGRNSKGKTRKGGDKLSAFGDAIGIFFGLGCSAVSLYFLGRVLAVASPTPYESGRIVAPSSLLQILVSRICAFGVLLSAALNGFGSVSMPHSCLVGAFHDPVHPEVVAKVEQDLRRARDLLATAREQRADQTEGGAPSARRGGNPGDGGLFHRRVAAIEKNNQNLAFQPQPDDSLASQVETLEALCQELSGEVQEMREVQRLGDAARTLPGKAMGAVGVIFSVVLLIRLLFAIARILRFRYRRDDGETRGVSGGDPITSSLLFLAGHHLVSREQYEILSQTLSLLLTACLSVSQIRNFFRTGAAVSRRLGVGRRQEVMRHSDEDKVVFGESNYDRKRRSDWRFDTTTDELRSLMITSIVGGSYFLSCIVMIKMTLPNEYRASMVSAMNGLGFSFDTRTTDLVFASSAIVAAVAMGILFGIRRQNYRVRSWSSENFLQQPKWDVC